MGLLIGSILSHFWQIERSRLLGRHRIVGHIKSKMGLMLCLVAGLLFYLEPVDAQTICGLKFRLSNQLKSPSSASYKLGVKLDRSLLQYDFGDPQILSSAKAIWSQGLASGASTSRTINLRFGANCNIPRQFEFYVCWLRSGQAGRATCKTLSPIRVAGLRAWIFTLQLVADPVSSKPTVRMIE